MFATFFGKVNRTSRNSARSRQLEVETLEARCVPSTFQTLVDDAAGRAAWSAAPVKHVREVVIGGAMAQPSDHVTVEGGNPGGVIGTNGVTVQGGSPGGIIGTSG